MSGRVYRVGSLFTGIGLFERGLSAVLPIEILWQAENDPFCRALLETQLYPGVKLYDDVRAIDERADAVDIICGGFPCQDVSVAGSGEGLAGARSGLWSEYERIVRVLRPRYVLVENVSALASRGLDDVLGGLAALRYDAWWDCLPAEAVGAPHRRDRIFLVAWRVPDPQRARLRNESERGGSPARAADSWHAEPEHVGEIVGDPASARRAQRSVGGERREEQQPIAGAGGEAVADSDRGRQQSVGLAGESWRRGQPSARGHELDRRGLPFWPPAPDDLQSWGAVQADAQPAFCRMADGLAAGLYAADARSMYTLARPARLKALGNAIVPQVVEVIAHVLLDVIAYVQSLESLTLNESR